MKPQVKERIEKAEEEWDAAKRVLSLRLSSLRSRPFSVAVTATAKDE
jgi:hypothetical protein